MSIADLTQAELAREQWERYKTSFLPVLQDMSSDLMSGARLKESLALVPEQVEQSFAQQQAGQMSQLQRMGVDPTQSAQSVRQTELEKAKATTSSKNELRTFHEDLKKQAIIGASGSIGSLGS